jgi:hypothetical protein
MDLQDGETVKAPTDLFDWTITLKFLWNKGTIRTLVCESDTVQDLIERVSEFTRIPDLGHAGLALLKPELFADMIRQLPD